MLPTLLTKTRKSLLFPLLLILTRSLHLNVHQQPTLPPLDNLHYPQI